MKLQLILLRGLPGSGKSTLARTLSGIAAYSPYQIYCYEADDYFYDLEGNYNFDGMKLEKAHEYCQSNTRFALTELHASVIVSNTSTTEKEVYVYKAIAEEAGADFVSLVVENRHGNSSIHSVPDYVMINMKNRFVVAL